MVVIKDSDLYLINFNLGRFCFRKGNCDGRAPEKK